MVTSLALDWTKVVSGSRDGTARIWDMTSGRCVEVCAGHSACVSGVTLSEQSVVTVSWDGDARCWFA
jgi:F-box and WD-40 domain protein CDC4